MSQKTKLFVAIIMLIAAGSYAWMKTRAVTPGAVANNGITDEFGGMEDREQRMQQLAKVANITPEQQKKLEELREKPGEDGGRFTEIQKILTPEQRTKIRENFQQQRVLRDAKMQKVMSDAEFQRYQEKRRERFGGRGGRRGGREGGRRGGGAPSTGGATSQANSTSIQKPA